MPKQYGGPSPRLMYPAAALSRSLSRCDALAQLLFDRLVTQADDQGRMIADPDVVRGQCLPLVKEATAGKVARWLGQLADQEMILIYEAEGHNLLQILNWWEYQNGMRRAYPSRWEAPPDWDDQVFGLPSGSGNGAGPTPPKRGQRARKMPAQNPHQAGNEPAMEPQGAGTLPVAHARVGAPAANRIEETNVSGTEHTPLPPSPGGGESGGMLAEYQGFLAALSQATGVPWREESLSRSRYLERRQEGFTAVDLDDAARGVVLDPWFAGRNADGVPKFDPATVLRSPKLQTFIGLARGQIAARGSGPAQFDAFADALEAGADQPLRLVEGGSA